MKLIRFHRDLANCLSSILKTVELLQGLKQVVAVRSRAPTTVDEKIKQLELFDDGFVEVPEEIYAVTENAAKPPMDLALSVRVNKKTGDARIRADDAQVELFKELPKPSRRKKRGRKK